MPAPRILTIVGTRPNFIKVTQFARVFADHGLDHQLLHTGQHYDLNMAGVFFAQFGLQPDHQLALEHRTPTGQMADILLGLERFFTTWRPDLVLVPGDVNSTLAAALAANKLGIPIGHIESGLRSADRAMPEEHNRVLTDHLADLLFVTEQSGLDNLQKEHIPADRIHFVGNTMIDTLVAFQDHIAASDILQKTGVPEGGYFLMTMHRPATVDNQEGMEKLTRVLRFLAEKMPVVFPVHPRTRKKLESFQLLADWQSIPQLHLLEPQGYFAFQKLIAGARAVITDSGGIQEETTFCQVPCLTLRPNTERPSTLDPGSNTLVPFEVEVLAHHIDQILQDTYKAGSIPPLWDGKASERIAEQIVRFTRR